MKGGFEMIKSPRKEKGKQKRTVLRKMSSSERVFNNIEKNSLCLGAVEKEGYGAKSLNT